MLGIGHFATTLITRELGLKSWSASWWRKAGISSVVLWSLLNGTAIPKAVGTYYNLFSINA